MTISLTDPAQVKRAKLPFSRLRMEEDAHRRLGRAIAVGAGGSRVFLYAGSEIAAREAERVARQMLAEHHVQAEFALDRWHPLEEEWENAEVAMPRTEAEREAEHQKLLDEETAESLATGVAQWQARVELASHREAVALANTLRSEGRAVIRRWRFLVIGANNQDDADELAEQVRREAPQDATVRAEHSVVFLPFIAF